MDEFPPRLSSADAALLVRRQRGRNMAMLIGLVCLAVLFFAITIVKFKAP
jgi:hypothetical protein